MRFLVDESTGPAAAEWLTTQGHEIFSVYDSARGMDDDDIVQKAFDENWILITNDKDFGEQVYRERKPHHGIVLLRLDDERAKSKIEVLKRLLRSHADNLPDQFVVATEKSVRFAKK
jgi:predicted nuclease of predicted toxin-antitoxin system